MLEALLASHAPLGAYELIDRLAARGARPAPITIYRALDFLREQGLVHRIESRNAFIACVHNHDSGDPVVFLICEKCGAVGEAASAAVADTIKTASRAAGFSPKTPVIEISGICAHCKAAVIIHGVTICCMSSRLSPGSARSAGIADAKLHRVTDTCRGLSIGQCG